MKLVEKIFPASEYYLLIRIPDKILIRIFLYEFPLPPEYYDVNHP